MNQLHLVYIHKSYFSEVNFDERPILTYVTDLPSVPFYLCFTISIYFAFLIYAYALVPLPS